MQENTNRAIVINSFINYAKMAINTILALLTTRFALLALGVTDYGLFSILGSIISFIGVFNSVMMNSCNRFMAVAIGKGNNVEINKIFNVNLIIFIGCALLMILIAFPIGFWYIDTKINYEGLIENAYFVFSFSIVSSILSTLATPYNGLLIARERFFVFSMVDVIKHLLSFLITYILVNHYDNKLQIYTVSMSILTSLPLFVYWWYSKKCFPEITRWNFVKEKSYYKEIFSFSGWVAYGAVACIAKVQGAALLVNAFFNTIMNAALGIANSLGNYVTMFATSLTQPIQPQITKSYTVGDTERTNELLIFSTKCSFMLMLFIGTPFLVASEWILHIWLGDVPPFASTFTVLLVIDNIVLSFNSGLNNLIFASGKIALYQILINTLRLFSIVVAYFVLNAGYPAYSLLVTYIVFSVFVVLCTQWCLHKTLNYDNRILFKKSYMPSFCILLLMMPVYLYRMDIHPILDISIALIYLLVLDFTIGLTKKEKKYLLQKIHFYNGKEN